MQASLSVSVSMAGITASSTQTRTEDGLSGVTPTCAPAVAGELTTRNSASAGVITVTSTDLVTGDKAILTWVATNGDLEHRYNVDIVVTTTTITVSNGTGDDLPEKSSDINVGIQTQANVTFDFDDVDTFCITTNVRGVIAFMDTDDTEKLVVDMDAKGIALWTRDTGFPEPMSGTPITYILYGSGDTSTTDFAPKVLALYDATDPSGSGQ